MSQSEDSERLTPLNQVVALSSQNRIDELPCKALCRILAFLPLRLSVATSILSRAWQYDWTDIPVLDFTDLPSSMTNLDNDFSEAQSANFVNFVNRVLLLNRAPCLERIHIEIHVRFNIKPRQVYEWMRVIANRCVQELYFIYKYATVSFPKVSSPFLENLAVLRLEGFILDMYEPFHLPCLRSLSLTKVHFPDILEDDPLPELLEECPVLEELNIDRCTGIKDYTVSSASIKILRIVSDDDKKVLVMETPNLEVLHLALGIIRSEVDDDLSSLVKVRLDIWTSSIRWKRLLQKFRHTQALVLHWVILDVSSIILSDLFSMNWCRLQDRSLILFPSDIIYHSYASTIPSKTKY